MNLLSLSFFFIINEWKALAHSLCLSVYEGAAAECVNGAADRFTDSLLLPLSLPLPHPHRSIQSHEDRVTHAAHTHTLVFVIFENFTWA